MSPAVAGAQQSGPPVGAADRTPGRLLLVIGDSLAAGAARLEGNELVEWVRPTYVDLLRERFPGWEIVLDAAPRRRTADVAPAVVEMLASARPEIVLVATGGNDVDLDWRRFVASGGEVVRSRTPLQAFRDATRLVAGAVAACGAVAVVGDVMSTCLAVRLEGLRRGAGRSLDDMIVRGGGQARADQVASEYRRAVAEAAAETGAVVARYGEALDGHEPREMLGPDGVHVSASGHRVMAGVLAPALEEASALVAQRRAGGKGAA